MTTIDLRSRAREIHKKVQEKGTQQVRLHLGHLFTFQYPAPRGYGTRGAIVAIYTPGVSLEWIEDDLLSLEGITRI